MHERGASSLRPKSGGRGPDAWSNETLASEVVDLRRGSERLQARLRGADEERAQLEDLLADERSVIHRYSLVVYERL